MDLVISTVSGHSQINLIDAAFHSRVRRFVPAEFEGPPVRRPANDPTDRGRAACLDRLRHWSHHRHPMRSTIFVCGVFYERFARGGLAALSVGSSTGVAYPGSYLMNVETNTAEVVERDGAGRPIHLVLTSINDVARFVTAAIALGPQTWPGEFRMQGDRRTVAEILQCAEAVRGKESMCNTTTLLTLSGAQFLTEEIQAGDLNAHLEYATYYQDWAKVARMHELIASERRGYDFTTPNLNPLVNVQPVTFWAWISQHWAGA